MQNQYTNSSFLYYDLPIYYIDEDVNAVSTFNNNSFDNMMALPLFPDVMQDIPGEGDNLYPNFSIMHNGVYDNFGAGNNGASNSFIQNEQCYRQQDITDLLDFSPTLIDSGGTTMLGTISVGTHNDDTSLSSPQYYYASSIENTPQQYQQQQQLEQETFFMQQYLLQQEEFFQYDNGQTIDSFLVSPSLSSQGNFVNTSPYLTIPIPSTRGDRSVTSSISSTSTGSSSSFGNTTIINSNGSSNNGSSNKRSRQQQLKIFCPECHKQLGRPQDLNRHYSSIHEGKRNFHCKVCPSTFARKDALNRHIKTFSARGDRRHGTYQRNCGKSD